MEQDIQSLVYIGIELVTIILPCFSLFLFFSHMVRHSIACTNWEIIGDDHSPFSNGWFFFKYFFLFLFLFFSFFFLKEGGERKTKREKSC